MSKFNELLINASTKEELEEITSLAKARLKEIKEEEYPNTCLTVIQEAINEIKVKEIKQQLFVDKKVSFPYMCKEFDYNGNVKVLKGSKRVELHIVYEVKE